MIKVLSLCNAVSSVAAMLKIIANAFVLFFNTGGLGG